MMSLAVFNNSRVAGAALPGDASDSFIIDPSFVLDPLDLDFPTPEDLAFFEAADFQNLDAAFFSTLPACSAPSVPDVCDSMGLSEPSSEPSAGGPMRRRRPKVPVPEEVRNTQRYQERRRKNNLAAARNREMKKQVGTVDPLPGLIERNIELNNEARLLRANLVLLYHQVQQRLAERA
jgi:hypothetical protein